MHSVHLNPRPQPSRSRIFFSLSALCFVTAFLLTMAASTRKEEETASRIAPEILRFHVLADSNRKEDQELKLGVKTLVLNYIQSHISQEAGKEEIKDWVLQNRSHIESMAQDWLASMGNPLPVSLCVAKDHFPTKAYGDMVFPCGSYEAVRITIGSGKGRNWWCVLYPSLCYTGPSEAAVPPSSKVTLSTLLSSADYESLFKKRHPAADPASPSLTSADPISPEAPRR